jgi:O-methyltransferase
MFLPQRLQWALNRRLERELLRRGFARDYRGYPDFDEDVLRFVERVQPYTQASPERIACLRAAVRYVSRRKIPGAIVECGVGKGGSMLAAALTLMEEGKTDRDLWLFDTFVGMTAPTAVDIDYRGRAAAETTVFVEPERLAAESGSEWIRSVRSLLVNAGYDGNRLRLIKGPVEETIPAQAPAEIALLRLDTDWYASTRHELEHLYPRVANGGVLIVDDYGHYRGCRLAVDEYFACTPILLQRIDYTGRLALKV